MHESYSSTTIPPSQEPRATKEALMVKLPPACWQHTSLFGSAVTMICLAVGISNIVPPSLALTNGGSITALGVPLTENFDTLASTGTNIAWTDNSTIPGWYSTRATFNSGTGSSNTGALYSFGVAGTNAAHRSRPGLGRVRDHSTVYPGSQADEQHRRARLLRSTSAISASNGEMAATPRSIHSCRLPISGCQRWRHHRRQCSDDRMDDFCSAELYEPTSAATAAATLDGNAAANRRPNPRRLRSRLPPARKSGCDGRIIDDAGNDHGLAIDDLSVTANGSPRR